MLKLILSFLIIRSNNKWCIWLEKELKRKWLKNTKFFWRKENVMLKLILLAIIDHSDNKRWAFWSCTSKNSDDGGRYTKLWFLVEKQNFWMLAPADGKSVTSVAALSRYKTRDTVTFRLWRARLGRACGLPIRLGITWDGIWFCWQVFFCVSIAAGVGAGRIRIIGGFVGSMDWV